MTDLKTLESTVLVKGEPFIGCIQTELGIISASIDGVVLFFGYDDTVEQLSLKCQARPSALYSSGQMLFVGDWEGNLYQYNLTSKQLRTFTFEKFQYENRTVPNGVYSICVANGQILVGLSSGELAVGAKGNFSLLKVHEKAIRQIIPAGEQIVTVGNDGRACQINLKKMESIEI